jgi:hypothetical protein
MQKRNILCSLYFRDIYFCRKKRKWKRQPRRRSSATGQDAMVERFLSFLIGHFTFLGFEFQYWMPVSIGAIAIYFLYFWKTGQW